MKLYLMRHANADWPNWTGNDDDRPLTDKGHIQASGVSMQFARSRDTPKIILSSPLPRAMQTAQYVESVLSTFGHRTTADLREEFRLSPGATPEIFMELLREAGEDVVMVGHEPDLSLAVLEFTGEFVKMRKANAACVEFDENFKGRLVNVIKP